MPDDARRDGLDHLGGGLLLWRHATRREAEADQARRRRAQARGWHYDGRSRGITQFTIRGGDATLVWTFKHEYSGVSESPPTTSQWSTRDRRARPVPAGSAAFRQRFTVLAHDPSLGHAAIDGRTEDLLLRSPRPSDPGWRSDRHVSVWLDEFGLRVQCDASLVEVDEIEHVVALGLALAERCPRSAPAP